MGKPFINPCQPQSDETESEDATDDHYGSEGKVSLKDENGANDKTYSAKEEEPDPAP